MKLFSRILLSTVAAAMLPVTQSLAADYDPPIFIEDAPEYVPVEVGSGWYLRGDVGYNFERSFRSHSAKVDDTLFWNDYVGFGSIGPLDIMSFSHDERPITASVGIGYHFNDFLRADVTAGFLGSEKYRAGGQLYAGYLPAFNAVDTLNPNVTGVPDYGCLGTRTVTRQGLDADGEPAGPPTVSSDPDWRRNCGVGVEAKTESWNGLVNAYADLGTYAGFTPYVGAGLGLLYTRTKVSTNATCEASSSSTVSGGVRTTTDFLCRGQANTSAAPVNYTPATYKSNEFDLLYAISAGVSYQMTQNTSIDVGYQYLNAPNLEYYAVGGNGIESRKGIDGHQVKVGLRYDLW